MANSYRNRGRSTLNSLADDYKNMRTLPALISVFFMVATAFFYGAIDAPTFNWFIEGGYTLTHGHAIIGSLGVYVLAFMGSETKQFEHYSGGEQALVAAGPLMMIGIEYIQQIEDLFLAFGDPLGMQIAFAVTLVSFAVAVN